MATLQLKRSSTASAVPAPSALVAGELAINAADAVLFAKNANGDVIGWTADKAAISVTGSKASGAALTSLISALVSHGLIIDNTTA